ncbi:hypothetical protein BAE44_0020788 [Dichanthelium oligosanthes]|uniref:Uncharacterized protein n=1 Tax=Dichanthelium oligosanthes TaxID=888268 RepID=A0A1E5UZK4_9POAL|nr:hypothetical protein BAE44_0020788 [Dichanthelium oligosanthes]
MRLLSFVPCGCRAGPIDDAPPADHAGDAAAAARRRRRRRIRRAAAAGSVGVQWHPSLGDIYEECSSTDAAAKVARVAPARARKAASWDVARVLPRAHSDEHRHLESASSMPAFAPTAYLF